MSDESSTVKNTLLPSGTAAITDFPDSHLRTSSKPSDDDATRTASPSAARSGIVSAATSSRTSSAEATDTTTFYTSSSSSSPPPSSDPSSSISISTTPALPVPPWSLTRIPARLRRKCPMYADSEQAQPDGDDGAAAKSEEEDVCASVAPTSPPPAPLPRTPRTAPRRPRVPPPVPVPHLIKKSRGRRVPEPTEARERAHVCAVPGCSKSFARAEHLKRHVLSLHTHEKRTFHSTSAGNIS
jgi:hypothetical protein